MNSVQFTRQERESIAIQANNVYVGNLGCVFEGPQGLCGDEHGWVPLAVPISNDLILVLSVNMMEGFLL